MVISNPGLDASVVNMLWKSALFISSFNCPHHVECHDSYTNVKAVHVNLGHKYPA